VKDLLSGAFAPLDSTKLHPEFTAIWPARRKKIARLAVLNVDVCANLG
jgi:hypothetical protein